MSKKTTAKNITGSRHTIAAFLDLINFSYHERYWQGLVKGALDNDINLLSFADVYSSGRPKDYYNQIKAMINLANNPKIDGILSWSSTFSWTITKDKFKDFFQKTKNDPSIYSLISFPENTPIIIMESYEGIHQIMTHLVKIHGLRKIAFLRGPENHMGSNERYRAYKDSLKEFDIEYDPDLVTPPTPPENSWTFEVGENMTKLLLDRNKKKIEAIVAVNDNTAYGVLKCLNSRGIKVPNDIIVTGFDNHPQSITCIPSLTTIDPCFEELGRKSVEMIAKILNKEKIPLRQYVKSRLILRQSCRCYSPIISEVEIKNDKFKLYNISLKNKISELYKKNKVNIEEEARKAIAASSMADKTDILVHSFYEDIAFENSKKLMPLLTEVMQSVADNNEDASVWYKFFSVLYSFVLHYPKNEQLMIRLLNLIQQISIIIGETIQQVFKRKINLEAEEEQSFLIIEKELMTIFNINKVLKKIIEKFPSLGIKSCFLSLYEENKIPSEWSRLFLAYVEGKKIETGESGIHFRTIDLIPSEFLKEEKKYNIVIFPLYFQTEQLGFIIFEIGPKSGNIYERLSSILSNAIKGALLIKEIEQRSRELDRAYRELKDNQQKMLIMEKMASLGRLTAGIAHSMNTPLAAISSSLEELKALTDEYRSSISNSQVLPEDHQEIAGEMVKYIDIAINAVKKSSGFIRGIKGQTLNIKSNLLETFNASHVLQDAINLLEFDIKKASCKLIKNIDNAVFIYGNKNWLNQIIMNLVQNAVDASAKNRGTITVMLLKSGKTAKLIVEDTGEGINIENIPKIFDPLFTTKPFGEASGLGLTIVQEMVNHFKGTINVSSKPGLTTFTVELPLS